MSRLGAYVTTVVVGMYAPFGVVGVHHATIRILWAFIVPMRQVEDPTMGAYIATSGVATHTPPAEEGLHAGISPDSKAGDYSDVVVSTPFGEIPWRKLSRINDAEMRTLMVDVVQKAYDFIRELFDEKSGGKIIVRLAERDPAPRWEEPK